MPSDFDLKIPAYSAVSLADIPAFEAVPHRHLLFAYHAGVRTNVDGSPLRTYGVGIGLNEPRFLYIWDNALHDWCDISNAGVPPPFFPAALEKLLTSPSPLQDMNRLPKSLLLNKERPDLHKCRFDLSTLPLRLFHIPVAPHDRCETVVDEPTPAPATGGEGEPTMEELIALGQRLMQETGGILRDRNQAYSFGDDIFGNLRIIENLPPPPKLLTEHGILIRSFDKLARLWSLSSGASELDEKFEETVRDTLGYLTWLAYARRQRTKH